jgi:hypothetical protein
MNFVHGGFVGSIGEVPEVDLPDLRRCNHAPAAKEELPGEGDLSALWLLSLGVPGLQEVASAENAAPQAFGVWRRLDSSGLLQGFLCFDKLRPAGSLSLATRTDSL